MRKTSSLVMAAITFCVLTLSCGDGGLAGTPSSEWVTIEGRNVSLRLPANFEGGNPADPAVMSVLRGMAESRSDPLERESLANWLDTVQEYADRGDAPSLIAWHAPDDGGSIASVTVNWGLLQNLLFLSDGDSSMRALAEAYVDPLTAEEWRLDSLKAEEASVVAHYQGEYGHEPAEFTLIKVDGDLYWSIRYVCQKASWEAFYDTFKESSETFQLTL